MKSTSVHDTNRGSLPHEPLEVFKREVGFNPPRKFSRRISASEALVKRIGLGGKLNGHEGCVNTIEFNYCGDHLVSGSDDRRVMFWNVATRSLELSYASGHVDNIFQARIMPFTDDRTIVTSSADGQVRLGQIAENGHVHTKKLGKHHGRVHKLAVEPGSPHIFYSCGEDGLVRHDCGHIFIWNKKKGRLVRVMEGDRRIVNQVEPHPEIPVLASSGLERSIKLWVPMSNDILPLPHDLEEIVESNRRGREDHSPVTLIPDVIMHVLRLS